MRLINTSTYRLHEFFDKQIPLYAILSHRWENEEVTLQDLQEGRGPMMAGWSKIVGCCAQAAKSGWKYAWIDSCCIDKTSSAELSEAINSMFEWYRRAEVCYAYLSDVSLLEPSYSARESAFKKSKWFTRGWTLQELLAPQWVQFYDRDWVEIGTKSSLADLITSITGISHLFNFEDACLAQKMSWASTRVTTRVEDQAYCLLGLFKVHMPPLYGEGYNAFIRLQLEILSKNDDESIFAWWDSSGSKTGLLASSPEFFRKSGSIIRADFDSGRQPYSMTNKGLRLELALRQAVEATPPIVEEYQAPGSKIKRANGKSPNPPKAESPRLSELNSAMAGSFLAPLNCMFGPMVPEDPSHTVRSGFVALRLWNEKNESAARSWYRSGDLEAYDPLNYRSLTNMVIYTVPDIPRPVYGRPGTVLVRTPPAEKFPFSLLQKYKSGSDAFWASNSTDGYVLKSFYKDNAVASLLFNDKNYSTFAVVFGTTGFVFWVDIMARIGLVREGVYLSLEDILKNFVRSKEANGGGERISKVLHDGRVVSVVSRKELLAGSYRYVVDISV